MRKSFICYLSLLILSIIVFAGTGYKGIIDNGDTCFPVFPKEELRSSLYTWYPGLNFGITNHLHLLILPSIILRGMLEILGFKLWLINRLWFIGALFILGSSMFYFTSIFFKEKTGYIPRLLSAIFVVLNPYVFNRLTGGQVMMLWELASLIFMFGFFIKGIDSPSPSLKYAFLAGFASLFNGMVIRVLGIILLGIFTFWHLLFNITNLKKFAYSLKFTIITIIIIILLNFFWILPVMTLGTSNIIEETCGEGGDWGSLVGTSPFVRIFWSMRLLYGIFTVLTPYPKYLTSPFGIIISIILLLLIYSAVFVRPKRSYEYFFCILAIVSTYLATGLNYKVYASIYTWLWNNFSPFRVFRNPEKFQAILLLSYSVLLCLVCKYINLRLRHKKTLLRLINLLILAIIMINSWVFFTGDLLGDVKPVEIPDYYFKLREYLQGERYTRLLSLPIQWLLYNYKWSGYAMGDILGEISTISIVNKIPGEEMSGIKKELLYNKFYEPERHIPSELYGFCNIKYVLLQEDINSNDTEEIKNILDAGTKDEYVKKEKFGKLNLYEVSSMYLSPYIYTQSKITWVLNTEEEYEILSYSQFFKSNSVLIFSKMPPDEHIKLYRVIKFSGDNEITRTDSETIYIFQGKKDWDFFTPGGEYYICGKISQDIFRKKYIYSKYIFGTEGEFKNWNVNSVNTQADFKNDNICLNIGCLFNGDGKEDEFVQLNRKIERVDLEKYPWVGLFYKVDDAMVQTIEIVLGVDFDSDNKVDLHIRGLYPVNASNKWEWFEINALRKAKELCPGQKDYALIEIEIYPHKFWGIDTSLDRKGKYNFYIKELLVYRKSLPEYILNNYGRLVLSEGYVFSMDIFNLDGRGYHFTKTYLDKEDSKKEIFKYKIWLDKGVHKLSFGDDRSFGIDWLMIEPVTVELLADPDVKFKKINPTKYIVNVSNFNNPFWLLFKESFHNGWKAFIKNGKKYTRVKSHFKANSYANAWYIDLNTIPEMSEHDAKELEIIIEFMPQKKFIYGSIISLFSILTSFLYFILIKIKYG